MLIRTLLLACGVVSPVFHLYCQQTSPSVPPYVETSGFGERRVAPDRATLMINVTTKAQSAASAAAENARIQTRVLDTLRALGFGSVTTTANYNVGQNYEQDPVSRMPQPAGYAARAQLRVRLTEIGSIGGIIDATLSRGATGVDGVYYESSAAENLRRAALADAATMARADAEALARALGGALGPIISTTSTGGFDPRGQALLRTSAAYGGGYAGGVPTQITPSEIVITTTVLTRWQFSTAK